MVSDLVAGLPSLVVMGAAFTLATIVYVTRPGRAANRALAAILLAEGIANGLLNGVSYLMPDPQSQAAVVRTAWAFKLVVPATYLAFLATFRTRWAAPLRTTWFRLTTWAATAGLVGVWFLRRDLMPYEAWFPVWTQGLAVLFLTGFVLALAARAEATEPKARRDASLLALAFGWHDIMFTLYIVARETGVVTQPALKSFIVGVVFLGHTLLLSYAILRRQLFDIDIRLRRGIRRSTVAAVLIGAFLVASEAVEALLPVDGFAFGVGAAILVAFAHQPIQRLADRTAARLFPGADDRPAALDARRIEVYRTALSEAAAVDGALTPEDARRLAQLRRGLRLTMGDHDILLRELLENPRQGAPSAPARVTPTEDAVVLGRYRLKATLRPPREASHVWDATDDRTGARVVVKFVDEVAGAREAETLGQVQHPSLVRLVDAGAGDGWSILVFERAGAGSLRDRLRERGALPFDEWPALAESLLLALDALHTAGILHRDIKPENILFTDDGRAHLADLGVARLPGLEETMGQDPERLPVGTLRYMSPEQARGAYLTTSSDLYSAAATLYEALTGDPFLPVVPAETAHELRGRAARGRSVPRLGLAPPLQDWFGVALAPRPSDRHEGARQMLASLRAACEEAAPVPREA